MLDTSFLAHSLIPSQPTQEAVDELREAIEANHDLLVAPHGLVEFTSTLRRLTVKGSLTEPEARQAFNDLVALEIRGVTRADAYGRGLELAARLGQGDTFDSTGYAIAERLGAPISGCRTGGLPMPLLRRSCPTSASSRDARERPELRPLSLA